MIHLALPNYSGMIPCQQMDAVVHGHKQQFVLDRCERSALTYNFNTMYANALNARKDGVTHFAMLHNDVVPQMGWIDILVKEMEETKADVISVIIPIKFDAGLTSTALDIPKNDKVKEYDLHYPKRLALRELFTEYPETFTHEKILVNTGCMLMDIRQPWAEKIAFKFIDTIEKGEDGKFKAKFIPEDWDFSRQARSLGAKIYATRKVKVSHVGRMGYVNYQPWGTLERDQ